MRGSAAGVGAAAATRPRHRRLRRPPPMPPLPHRLSALPPLMHVQRLSEAIRGGHAALVSDLLTQPVTPGFGLLEAACCGHRCKQQGSQAARSGLPWPDEDSSGLGAVQPAHRPPPLPPPPAPQGHSGAAPRLPGRPGRQRRRNGRPVQPARRAHRRCGALAAPPLLCQWRLRRRPAAAGARRGRGCELLPPAAADGGLTAVAAQPRVLPSSSATQRRPRPSLASTRRPPTATASRPVLTPPRPATAA